MAGDAEWVRGPVVYSKKKVPNLPPFDPAALCLKCGMKDATVKFMKITDGGGNRIEVLGRMCIRCGFGWNELPLTS